MVEAVGKEEDPEEGVLVEPREEAEAEAAAVQVVRLVWTLQEGLC